MCPGVVVGGDGQAGDRAARPGGGGDHQPARDDAAVGQGERRADRQRRSSGRTPAPTACAGTWPARAARTGSARAPGLPLATYFSGPKIRWLLDNIDGARAAATRGELLFGTIDSWLIWKLTGRHVTDVTNASRTLLMNLATLDWDDGLLDGDRRAARHAAGDPVVRRGLRDGARACWRASRSPRRWAISRRRCSARPAFRPARASAPTAPARSCWSIPVDRPVQSAHGLLTTVGYRIGDAPAVYALEGSIAVAGSLGAMAARQPGPDFAAPPRSRRWRDRSRTTAVAIFVPAFSGLFAPHWRSDARGVIAGLTGYVTKGHIARAALEAVAWQVREVVDAMAADSGQPLTSAEGRRRHDRQRPADAVPGRRAGRAGGASGHRRDHLPGRRLRRRPGGRLLAGSRHPARANGARTRPGARRWRPDDRAHEYAQWNKAVERTLGWAA